MGQVETVKHVPISSIGANQRNKNLTNQLQSSQKISFFFSFKLSFNHFVYLVKNIRNEHFYRRLKRKATQEKYSPNLNYLGKILKKLQKKNPVYILNFRNIKSNINLAIYFLSPLGSSHPQKQTQLPTKL